MRFLRVFVRGAITVFLLLVMAGCMAPGTPPPSSGQDVPALPDVTYDAIRFDTEMGTFTVILYNQSAPQTVALMLEYVDEGYYEGRTFTRIVPGHVIQVTDAAGGVTDDARRVPLESTPGYHFSAGAVGIARGAEPDSGGPEFFVMDFATSHLAGNFTVWGQVIDGLETVHRVARGPAVDFNPIFRPLPPEAGAAQPTDRMALEPVAIDAATRLRVSVAGGTFPLQVAKNQRAGEYRHSLEWSASLRVGNLSEFTWYIRPYNSTPPPAAEASAVLIDGMELPVTGEATPGIYHFSWRPPDGLAHNATFMASGKPLATLSVKPASVPV